MEDLLLVVVRGTFDTEWIGNFVVESENSPNEHADFDNASRNMMDRINNYCKTNVTKEHTQMFICGHSRAGAVTDLLAHDLNVWSAKPVQKLRAYAFAPPNSTKSPSKDLNIFNTLFYQDPVGYVPVGYSKHGQTFVIGVCES